VSEAAARHLGSVCLDPLRRTMMPFDDNIELFTRMGVKMANKEQQGNANKKKEAKLTLKEKRIQKQTKKEDKKF